MKSAKIILLISLFLAVVTLTQACNTIATQPTQISLPDQLAADSNSWNPIQAATIQINAFPAEQQGENGPTVYERGLASLIQLDHETILVSHDHWNSLADIARVQFLDANSNLLAEISGEEFRSLIRYHDQGSMLLSTPAELNPAYLSLLASRSGLPAAQRIVPGRLAKHQALQVGQIVTIAYRVGENRSQVGTKQATIIELSEVEGLPAVRLQSLDGSVILPGDSGGGIWLDGKLIGNMWMTERGLNQGIMTLISSQPSTKYLDTSIAALIQDDFPGSLISNSLSSSKENRGGEDLMDW
jgi:hypothetical protein